MLIIIIIILIILARCECCSSALQSLARMQERACIWPGTTLETTQRGSHPRGVHVASNAIKETQHDARVLASLPNNYLFIMYMLDFDIIFIHTSTFTSRSSSSRRISRAWTGTSLQPICSEAASSGTKMATWSTVNVYK